MTNPVMLVSEQTRHSDGARIGRGLYVWCPGCDDLHRPQTIGIEGDLPDGPCWDWDGDVEAPTISPSLLVHGGSLRGPCHSFIRSGRWEFLSDSAHRLAGQTVPMVPLPDWLVEERA